MFWDNKIKKIRINNSHKDNKISGLNLLKKNLTEKVGLKIAFKNCPWWDSTQFSEQTTPELKEFFFLKRLQ